MSVALKRQQNSNIPPSWRIFARGLKKIGRSLRKIGRSLKKDEAPVEKDSVKIDKGRGSFQPKAGKRQ